MIVKINVNDNDFGERICNILKNKVTGLYGISDDYYSHELDCLYERTDDEGIREYCDVAKERDLFRNFLYYGEDGDGTNIKYDKKKMANIIKKSVLYLIRNSFDQDNIKYLESEIKVTFPKTMSGKWENAEVIYYFPTTYSNNKFLLF